MSYQALPDGLFIQNSSVAGQGVFTKVKLMSGMELGMSHLLIDDEIYRSPIGGFINHSEKPNCEKYLVGNKYYIRTISDIEPLEELFLKYTFYKVV
tara:strand:- start:826 stop:1113 length:288 start_codon:yes stop_codon:yes gene_type:complete